MGIRPHRIGEPPPPAVPLSLYPPPPPPPAPPYSGFLGPGGLDGTAPRPERLPESRIRVRQNSVLVRRKGWDAAPARAAARTAAAPRPGQVMLCRTRGPRSIGGSNARGGGGGGGPRVRQRIPTERAASARPLTAAPSRGCRGGGGSRTRMRRPQGPALWSTGLRVRRNSPHPPPPLPAPSPPWTNRRSGPVHH